MIRPHAPAPASRRRGAQGCNREMRSRKYRMVTTLERAGNRLIRAALRAGFAPRAFALLETTGRVPGWRGIPRWETGWTAIPSG
jgi:hypothetical protein